MSRTTLTLRAYGVAMRGFHHLAPAILKDRIKKGKEDPVRYVERLGQASVPRPKGALIWFHGVSVGEALSALPVMARLKILRPDLKFLITSATTTSAEILSKRLEPGMTHAYAPIDTPQAVAAFLDHWRPDLSVFIESDIWPNLLQALDRRGIKRALLSARITEKTYRGWQTFRHSVAGLLKDYAVIMAQDQASSERLAAMGCPLGAMANLKTLGEALPDAPASRAVLKAEIGDRPIILAASTHPNEETLIARALTQILASGDMINPLLIIAPRHPLRTPEILNELNSLGLKVARRSTGEPITVDTPIYLADTLGELGLFFRLSDLVIMGGSFGTGVGGHNPLEAARLGKAVIYGPDLYNWQGVFDGLKASGSGWPIQTANELTPLLTHLLKSSQDVEIANQLALNYAQDQGDGLERVMAALSPLLPAETEVRHGA